MEQFGQDTFYINAQWSTSDNKWLLEDGSPADMLELL